MSNWNFEETFKGTHCLLQPLSLDDLNALKQAVRDGDVWQNRYAEVPTPEKMEDEINRRLALKEQQVMIPFTVLDAKTQRVVGMTTYTSIDLLNQRLNIGWTWYAKSAQKTGINTECKYLLLKHALEKLHCIAVGFRVDALNFNSQRAVKRLGAKFEGTLRNFSRLADGNLRDMHCYSVLPHEWPQIKAHIEGLMRR